MKQACYALPAILFVCILLFVPEVRGGNTLEADSGNQTENSSGAADSLKSITEMPRESNHTPTFREIRLMPVTSFYDIWERQPGVIVKSGAAGGLHVRGSLSQAVEYYVDNVSDGNAFNYNAPALPPINSMEEVRIIPGGFSAEYGETDGGAMCITTKSVTKEGYAISLETLTNGILGGGQYDNEYNRNSVSFGGKLPFSGGHSDFFVSGVLESEKTDPILKRSNPKNTGFHLPALTFNLTTRFKYNFRWQIGGNFEQGKGITYVHDQSKGFWPEYYPVNSRRDLFLFTSLEREVGSRFKYRFTISHSDSRFSIKGQGGRDYQDFRTISDALPWVSFATLQPEYSNPFYEAESNTWQNGLSEEQAWRDYYHSHGYFEYDSNGNMVWRSLQLKASAYNNRYLDTGRWTYQEGDADIHYEPFDLEKYMLFLKDPETYQDYKYFGDIQETLAQTDKFGLFNYGFLPVWEEEINRYTSVSASFSGRFSSHDRFRAGGFVRYSQYNFTSLDFSNHYIYNYQYLQIQPLTGYFRQKPTTGALYLEDQFALGPVFLHLGIRHDYFHPHNQIYYLEDDTQKTKPSVSFRKTSPRLGIAVRMPWKSELQLHYGEYFNAGKLIDTYLDPLTARKAPNSANLLWADSEIRPYTAHVAGISFRKNVIGSIALEVNGYIKNSSDYPSLAALTMIDGEIITNYSYSNKNRLDIKGAEILIRKPFSRFLSGSLAYSYLDATIKLDPPLKRSIFDPASEEFAGPFPLPYDITHSFKAEINLFLPGNWGPQLGNNYLLANINTNLFYIYSSGAPYTSSDPRGVPSEPNSKRMPATRRLDMRVQKEFLPAGNIGLTIFADILNVLNRKNVVMVWSMTGKPDDIGYEPIFESYLYTDLAERWGYPSAEAAYEARLNRLKDYSTVPFFYGIPRIIRLGARLEIRI